MREERGITKAQQSKIISNFGRANIDVQRFIRENPKVEVSPKHFCLLTQLLYRSDTTSSTYWTKHS